MGDRLLLQEFRVVLPMTVEEYRVGHLYTVAEASKQETGGGEGVEVVKNEPFEGKIPFSGKFVNGQYTYKIYHLSSKVPQLIRMLAPPGSVEVHEESWNAWPYCYTEMSNPYMKESFVLSIETVYQPDKGQTDNVHELTPEELERRKVVNIDIAENAAVDSRDYKVSEDPSEFHSEKTGRGPLGESWTETAEPVMCAYKLMRLKFRWFGLQDKVEKIIIQGETRLFTNFHRKAFCLIDKWYGLTMEDIRDLEKKVKHEVDELRQQRQVRGMMEK